MEFKDRLKLYIGEFTKFKYEYPKYKIEKEDGTIEMYLRQESPREILVNITHYSPEGYDFQLFHGCIEVINELKVILKTLKL